jgi:hypothetical protein
MRASAVSVSSGPIDSVGVRRRGGTEVGDVTDLEEAQACRLAAEQRLDKGGRRRQEDLLRCRHLHQFPLVHHDDTPCEPDGLVDVMGDHEDGLAGCLVDAGHLALQRVAGDGIERPEWLVHDQAIGVGGERAGNADTLLLAAGELVPIAVAELFRRQAEQVHHSSTHSIASRPAEQPRHRRDTGTAMRDRRRG